MEYCTKKKLSSTTISHDLSETLIVKKIKKQTLPPFRCVGDGRSFEREKMIDGKKENIKVKTFDMISTVASMNSDEKLCFMTIYNQWCEDYEFAEIVDNKLVCKFNYQQKVKLKSKSEQNHFLAGFKSLKEKGLVKRIRRGVYMISPYAIIDTNGFQKENEKTWNSVD